MRACGESLTSANPMAVWDGSYNSTGYPVATTVTTKCDNSSPCTPDNLATHDMQMWSSQLAAFAREPPPLAESVSTSGESSPIHSATRQATQYMA